MTQSLLLQKKNLVTIKFLESGQVGVDLKRVDEAKKQLIELKEYLENYIFTQDEFDKQEVSLKKILLGS